MPSSLLPSRDPRTNSESPWTSQLPTCHFNNRSSASSAGPNTKIVRFPAVSQGAPTRHILLTPAAITMAPASSGYPGGHSAAALPSAATLAHAAQLLCDASTDTITDATVPSQRLPTRLSVDPGMAMARLASYPPPALRLLSRLHRGQHRYTAGWDWPSFNRCSLSRKRLAMDHPGRACGKGNGPVPVLCGAVIVLAFCRGPYPGPYPEPFGLPYIRGRAPLPDTRLEARRAALWSTERGPSGI